jgi:hypothetical protein
MDKEIMKTIHDFVESNKIQSFYAVAYGILPDVTLIQLTKDKNKLEPKLHILLNSAISTHEKDMRIMRERFPNIKIFYEHYDSKLYYSL